METKKCAIYARISPTVHKKVKFESSTERRQAEQEEMHSSLVQALEMCRAEALREGFEIVGEYIDEYVSGRSSKLMKSFNEMLEDARQGKFTRIYSRRVNRFGRNRNDMLKAQIELDELNISLKFVENGIDTAQPFGKSIMAIMAELAQMEREEILENTKRGREARKERGEPFGRKRKELKTLTIKQVRANRLLPVTDPNKYTWTKLEEITGTKRSTLIRKLKEEGFWDYKTRQVK